MVFLNKFIDTYANKYEKVREKIQWEQNNVLSHFLVCAACKIS